MTHSSVQHSGTEGPDVPPGAAGLKGNQGSQGTEAQAPRLGAPREPRLDSFLF